jgi:uncharacterized protein (UPF0254 family)
MKFTKSASIGVCLSAFLITSCSSSQSISAEAFCTQATNEIVAYQKEFGLRLLGGVFIPNTTGFTIFKNLEDDIPSLQKSDPVKYYNMGSDQDVMKLCKIEVK